MTAPPATASHRPLLTRNRVLIVVGVLLAIAGLVTVGLKPLKWSVWINGANKKEFQEYLLQEDDPDLIPRLVAGMRDSDKGTMVRVSLANVLLKKNRIAEVEALLREPALDHRIVAFQALVDKPYFRKQYVEDGTFGLDRLLEEWVADPKRTDRATALTKLDKVHFPPRAPATLLEKVRALLAPGTEADLRGRAALKLAQYQDCSAVPALLAAARDEADAEAALGMLSAILQIYDNEGSPCRKDMDEATVKALVAKAFERTGETEHDRALRLRAMAQYRRYPAWLAERAESLRRKLFAPGNPVERRMALEALVAAKDPQTVEAMPRFFHDVDADVRSSAVQSLPGDPTRTADLAPHEGSLIGFIRDEPKDGRGVAVEQAFLRLRQSAGEWVGFPEKYRAESTHLDAARRERIKALWKQGRFEDVTREQVVEAWWRWLARRNGVTDDAAIDAIQKTRASFWERARAGDVAGAKAILEKVRAEKPNLWSYESGWVIARS